MNEENRELTGAIGILGGTFNPFHNGHLALAQSALTQFHLKQVLVMPNHLPGYKDTSDLIPDNHRADMIKLALSGRKDIVFSDYELHKEGLTYTADTLTALHRQHPLVTWYFIMGGDSILYFDQWKEPDRILALAKLIIAVRDAADIQAVSRKAEELRLKYGNGCFCLLDFDPVAISSSDIRKRIRENLPTDNLISPEVEAYIHKHHLYH